MSAMPLTAEQSRRRALYVTPAQFAPTKQVGDATLVPTMHASRAKGQQPLCHTQEPLRRVSRHPAACRCLSPSAPGRRRTRRQSRSCSANCRCACAPRCLRLHSRLAGRDNVVPVCVGCPADGGCGDHRAACDRSAAQHFKATCCQALPHLQGSRQRWHDVWRPGGEFWRAVALLRRLAQQS